MSHPSTSKNVAFSYVRFSHPKQADGGGHERQTRQTLQWCERKGVRLDDTLHLQDLGVSAFRGDNVRDGALAGFLEACRIGRVPRGSFLIVESLDRISRNDIRPALQLFLALQDFGITIVTHEPAREYSPEQTDALALIEPLIIFARAHEESVIKSHRRKDGWRQARDRARAGGGPMLKECPAWLEVTPEGFLVKPDGGAIVKRIFDLCRGGAGVVKIAETLTREGVPALGRSGRWVTSYVWRIVTGTSAMGTCQPHKREGKNKVPDGEAIPNFFPAVVTAEEWQEAQGAVRGRSNGQGAGRRGRDEANLFTGLVRCARTRRRMQLIHAMGTNGGAGPRKKFVYLASTRETGSPDRGDTFDYVTLETAILSRLRELRPADVAVNSDKKDDRGAEVLRQSSRLLDIDARLERAKQRARTAADFDVFLDLIQSLQAERNQVSERLADLHRQEATPASASLGEAHSLIDLLARTPADQREEVRRRLKVRIRQLVSELWVLIVRRKRDRIAFAQLWFTGGEKCRSYAIMYRPGAGSGKGRREAETWVRSADSMAAIDGLDLRIPDHAQRLEAVLAGMDTKESAE